MRFSDMMYYLDKLCNTIVSSWVWSVFCVIVSFFAEIKLVAFSVILAFSVDFLVGIIASRHAHIPIASKRLRKTVVKVSFYIGAIMLLFVFEKAYSIEWFVAHKAFGAFICYVEFVSILENIVIITDGDSRAVKILRWIRGKAAEKYGSIAEDIAKEKND